MRICRVMPSYPTDVQPGIGLAAFELLAHIPYPTLVITKKRHGTPVEPPAQVRLVRLPYWEVTLGNRKGLQRSLRVAIKAIGYFLFWILSVPIILGFRPDITHIHTPMPMLHGVFAKFFLRNRLYLSFHGTDIQAVQRSRWLQVGVRRADVICIVSEVMRCPVRGFFPKGEILYTPNGVDTVTFMSGSGERQDVICMVGSLRWQKDYPTALEAFAIFTESMPGWRLAIIGEGPDHSALSELTQALGIHHAVAFKGPRSREEVASLMRSSKIFLLSSVSEGFPKVILEAASTGTPIVVTDVGSCREVAEVAGGRIAPPRMPNALAQALLEFANDSDARTRASEQGCEAMRRYQWSTTAALLSDSYAGADTLDR